MIKYKHPVEYIPKRIRLFFFFSTMALVSLFKPNEGQEMINLANEGTSERARKEVYKLWHGSRCD